MISRDRPEARSNQSHGSPLGDASNRIELSGSLSSDADPRTLEDGRTLVLLRLSVRRPDASRVDSLPVIVGPPPARGQRLAPGQARAATVRRAQALRKGEQVRLTGWLRRHFWTAADGRRSRLQVVAIDLERT